MLLFKYVRFIFFDTYYIFMDILARNVTILIIEIIFIKGMIIIFYNKIKMTEKFNIFC